MEDFLKAIGLDSINGYHFSSLFGDGKASTTCLYENDNDEKIFVKLLIAPSREDELTLFESEINATQKVAKHNNHMPNIIKGFTQHRNFPVFYFILEYIEGKTLSKIIEGKPLPWNIKESIATLYCVASALSRISSRFIIHRDLHPGNIIFRYHFDYKLDYKQMIENECENVVILDLGCQKDFLDNFIGSKLKLETPNLDKIRDYFRHFGAISTWSPEFLKNPEHVDWAHDIWSLGVLLYRLLTNKFPIEASTFSELYENTVVNFKINWDEIKKLEISWVVRELLEKMLSQSSHKRILHRGITRICYDILEYDLLNKEDPFLRKYMDKEGDLVICPSCKLIITPEGVKCPLCGRMCEPDDWLPPFIDIK